MEKKPRYLKYAAALATLSVVAVAHHHISELQGPDLASQEGAQDGMVPTELSREELLSHFINAEEDYLGTYLGMGFADEDGGNLDWAEDGGQIANADYEFDSHHGYFGPANRGQIATLGGESLGQDASGEDSEPTRDSDPLSDNESPEEEDTPASPRASGRTGIASTGGSGGASGGFSVSVSAGASSSSSSGESQEFDNEVEGTDDNDDLAGGDGADHLSGNDGDDSLVGNDGDDLLEGDGGNDNLVGGAGEDELIGGADDDVLDGGADDDVLSGGSGEDNLSGGDGDDQLSGGEDNDVLDGGANDDLLEGGSGDDNLSGGSGEDQLSGGDDNDTLDGGADDDVLDGGAGDDQVSGGQGDDELVFGQGNDELDGGSDNDTYIWDNQYSSDNSITDESGYDVIEYQHDVDTQQITARVSDQDNLLIQLDDNNQTLINDQFNGKSIEELQAQSGEFQADLGMSFEDLVNSAQFDRTGIDGTFETGADINNQGHMSIDGTLVNKHTFTQSGELENHGTLINTDSGEMVFENDTGLAGDVQNNGLITVVEEQLLTLSGSVSGNGQFIGDVLLEGADVSLGEDIGIMTFDNLAINDSELFLRVWGSERGVSFDGIDVLGDLYLAGPLALSLDMSQLDWSEEQDSEFALIQVAGDLLDAAGDAISDFSSYTWRFTGGWIANWISGDEGWSLNLSADNGQEQQQAVAIPEPATWALVVLGMGGLLFLRTRRAQTV